MTTPLRFPEYPGKPHKTGQARIRLPGTKTDVYLGRWDSPEARRQYERVRAEWFASGGRPAPRRGLTVAELIAAYRVHAADYYRDADRQPTSEVRLIRPALRRLRKLYGDTAAAEFGPLALQAVRRSWVEPGRCCRRSINQYVSRIVACFRWGVEQQLVPPAVWQALKAVRRLQAGRTDAPDRPAVPPAPEADVEAALACMREPLRTLVLVQRLSGMRPGEACRLRGDEIDRSVEPWAYKLSRHKTRHKGKTRWVFFGPRCRALLQPLLEKHGGGHLFVTRAGTPYSRNANRYRKALHKACERAGVPAFNPNALRHSAATEARRLGGLEAAQQFLGHSERSTTERHYALPDLDLARAVAEKIG